MNFSPILMKQRSQALLDIYSAQQQVQFRLGPFAGDTVGKREGARAINARRTGLVPARRQVTDNLRVPTEGRHDVGGVPQAARRCRVIHRETARRCPGEDWNRTP